MVVVNASNLEKITRWVAAHLPREVSEARGHEIVWSDVTRLWAMFAIQGPRSVELVQPLVDVDPQHRPSPSVPCHAFAEQRTAVEVSTKPIVSSTSASTRSGSAAGRSILLTASTTCFTPISDRMKLWRRVWVRSPLRASTSITATWAVEAPVTMLRTNSTWPGASRIR